MTTSAAKFVLVASVLVGLACPAQPAVSRERAIDIARQELSFEPDSVAAELETHDERQIWRVVFTGRLPGQPPGLFETRIVDIDAATGDIIGVART